LTSIATHQKQIDKKKTTNLIAILLLDPQEDCLGVRVRGHSPSSSLSLFASKSSSLSFQQTTTLELIFHEEVEASLWYFKVKDATEEVQEGEGEGSN